MPITYMSTSDLKEKGWKGKGYYPGGSSGLWVRTDDSGNIISYIPLQSRIRNANGDYVQFNSDGTVTKLYDASTQKFDPSVTTQVRDLIQRDYVKESDGWRPNITNDFDSWLDTNYNDIKNDLISTKEGKQYLTQMLGHNKLNLTGKNLDQLIRSWGSRIYNNFAQKAGVQPVRHQNVYVSQKEYNQSNPDAHRDQRGTAKTRAKFQWRQHNYGKSDKEMPNYDDFTDEALDQAAYGSTRDAATIADNLEKGFTYGNAAVLGGMALGPTALSNLKYMVQHPVESFVVYPQVSNLLEKGASKFTDNKLAQKAVSLFGSGISVPALMQSLRRHVGTPLLAQFEASQAGKQLYNYVKGAPEYLSKAMTNVDLNFNPTVSIAESVSRNPTVQNTAKQLFVNKPLQYLYYYTPGAVATSGIATGLDALDLRTGNGFVDGAVDTAIYTTGAKGSNKAKALISNLKTLSGGAQTFSEGATNILRNINDHGVFNLFSNAPTSSTKYYTMSYKPSDKQLAGVDNNGRNTGQGGNNSFASYESEGIGIKPLSDYENLIVGEAPGKDKITVISKDYVGHKSSENSPIQEILLNQSYTNFPGDRNRQTKGSRRVIAVSNGESALTIPELKSQGFTQYVNKDKEFKDYNKSEDLQDILQFSGRGDFRQGDSGYSYNGAGMRISGIFRNPETSELKVFMHDPSGVGSVGYQNGSPGIASAMADSDSPSVNVFKTETLSSPEELKVFNNRYLQRDPNKAHVPNNLKDKVLSFIGLRHANLLADLHQSQEQAKEFTIKEIENRLERSKKAESEYNKEFSSWKDKLLHPFENAQATYKLQQQADDLQAALNKKGEQYKEKDAQTESSKEARRALMTEVVQNSYKKQGGKFKYFI